MILAAPWLAGVDGCNGGWIAAFMRPDDPVPCDAYGLPMAIWA